MSFKKYKLRWKRFNDKMRGELPEIKGPDKQKSSQTSLTKY